MIFCVPAVNRKQSSELATHAKYAQTLTNVECAILMAIMIKCIRKVLLAIRLG